MMEFIAQAGLAYIVFIGAMYYFQDSFLYFPQKDMLEPSEFGLPEFEPLGVVTQDEERLMLWWKPPLPNYPVVIYFHGNAGHLGMRAEKLAAFAAQGLGVLGVSWRGYGASTGLPSERGLYEDGRAALVLALEHLGVAQEKIILYGESLGTGVAVQLGTLDKLGLIVLEAPYLSVVKRAEEKFPYLPIRYMLKSRFDSVGKIGALKSPLLILHGERDEIIPVRHGRALLEAAPDPKKGIFLPTVGHSDFSPQLLATEVMAYAREQGLLPERDQP